MRAGENRSLQPPHRKITYEGKNKWWLNVTTVGQTSQGQEAIRCDKICSVYSHTQILYLKSKHLKKKHSQLLRILKWWMGWGRLHGKAALTEKWPGPAEGEEQWPLLMQWHIPAITKMKQAWDNYSRQRGEDKGHRLVDFWGSATHPWQKFGVVVVGSLIPSKLSLDINSSRCHTEGI